MKISIHLLAPHHRQAAAHPLAERDEVRVGPRLQRPLALLEAQELRGGPARQVDRHRRGHLRVGDEAPDAVEDRERAPRQAPRALHRHPPFRDDVGLAVVADLPLRRAEREDRVAHQDERAGTLELEEEDGRPRAQVLPVVDEPAREAVDQERGVQDRVVAVVQPRHPVEDVGHVAKPAFEHRAGDVGRGGVRVAGRHDDASPRALLDDLERPRQLGRQRHHPQQSLRILPVLPELGDARPPEVGGPVRPSPLGAEERPLEVDAQDPRPALEPGRRDQVRDPLPRRRLRERDERGEVGRHPVLQQPLPYLEHLLRRRLAEGMAEAAVDLGVDQAGRRKEALRVEDLRPAGGDLPGDPPDPAALDQDVPAVEELPSREDHRAGDQKRAAHAGQMIVGAARDCQRQIENRSAPQASKGV